MFQFVDWGQFEFGSRYQDVDLLVTESVLSGQCLYGGDKDRAESVYMTVRNQVVDTRKQHSHHGYTSQHPQHSSRRRSRDTGEASAVMYDKKYAMDSDYREYYRDRPRGEFLTRGAALSSQQSAAAANVAARAAAVGQHPTEPTYGVTGGGRRGGGGQPGGHDLTHAQYQQVAAGQHAQHAAAAARLGRNVSNEKISTPRNPTILRKSIRNNFVI